MANLRRSRYENCQTKRHLKWHKRDVLRSRNYKKQMETLQLEGKKKNMEKITKYRKRRGTLKNKWSSLDKRTQIDKNKILSFHKRKFSWNYKLLCLAFNNNDSNLETCLSPRCFHPYHSMLSCGLMKTHISPLKNILLCRI